MKTLLWTLAIPALIGAPYEEARAMKLAEGGAVHEQSVVGGAVVGWILGDRLRGVVAN
jgi:hypothetical protein